MYCIGLTGNIGSGKTTALKFFADQHIPTIVADDIARSLTAVDEPAYHAIVKHFGPSVLQADNTLNRRALRAVIFNQPAERLWLENLLHPLIRQRIEQRIADLQGPYCVIEIPLLLRRDAYPYLNRVLLIVSPTKTQIQRIMQRDHCSEEQALAILNTQPDEQERKRLADDIIINDGVMEDFEKSIKKLHNHYLHLADHTR